MKTRNLIIIIALCVLQVCCAIVDGADVVMQYGSEYSGCEDGTLWENTDWNLGALEDLYSHSSVDYLPVIEFDLSHLPAGTTFDSAALELYVSSNSTSNLTPNLGAFMMLMSFTFGDGITTAPVDNTVSFLWRNYHSNPAYKVGWNADGSYSYGPVPGVSFSTDVSAACGTLATATNSWLSFDITNMVQLWLGDPSGNHGLIIYSSDSTVYWFRSCDYIADPSVRPRLTLYGVNIPDLSFELSWIAKVGSTYQVLESSDLEDWSPVGSPILADKTRMKYTVYPVNNKVFYRLKENTE